MRFAISGKSRIRWGRSPDSHLLQQHPRRVGGAAVSGGCGCEAGDLLQLLPGLWHVGIQTTRHRMPQFLPMDETHPLSPQNAYALSKASNEQFARLMARDYGLSVAAFRLPWVVGHPGDGYHHRLLQSIEKPEEQRREGMRTYIHASDVARACALAVENPRPGFEAYHFTAAEVASAEPIRDVLIKQWPDLPPLPSDWPKYKSPVLMEKARQHFGWEPQFNLMDLYRQKHGRDPQ